MVCSADNACRLCPQASQALLNSHNACLQNLSKHALLPGQIPQITTTEAMQSKAVGTLPHAAGAVFEGVRNQNSSREGSLVRGGRSGRCNSCVRCLWNLCAASLSSASSYPTMHRPQGHTILAKTRSLSWVSTDYKTFQLQQEPPHSILVVECA